MTTLPLPLAGEGWGEGGAFAKRPSSALRAPSAADRAIDPAKVLESLKAPTYLLKIIPHVDCSPRICELVEYNLEDITVKGAWEGPAGLELHDHALAPLTQLPVREVISATHILTDLTLGLGRVVHDYLAPAK